MLKIYPVGSIYISVNNTNPTDLFGGTWEKIEDKFLLGSSTSYIIGSTGGEATHKLTANEMPNHTHKVNGGDWIVSVTQSFATTGNLYYAATGNKSFQGGSLTASGGGNAHNNMPPYLAVNIWKRTE